MQHSASKSKSTGGDGETADVVDLLAKVDAGLVKLPPQVVERMRVSVAAGRPPAQRRADERADNPWDDERVWTRFRRDLDATGSRQTAALANARTRRPDSSWRPSTTPASVLARQVASDAVAAHHRREGLLAGVVAVVRAMARARTPRRHSARRTAAASTSRDGPPEPPSSRGDGLAGHPSPSGGRP